LDNLTHTLIGLAAGEAMARCTRARQGGLADPARRTTLLALGVIGGNLPDADLLWSMQVFTGDSVDYLVDHRGHTHTLVACVALAGLMLLATLAILRWRGQRFRAPDAGLLGAMALLAVMLHLGMDALNEYGVHPFWPWDNRWYYGDSVFIVEPLFWLATAPLYFSLRTRVARILLALVITVGCIAVLAFHRFGVVWWDAAGAGAAAAVRRQAALAACCFPGRNQPVVRRGGGVLGRTGRCDPARERAGRRAIPRRHHARSGAVSRAGSPFVLGSDAAAA
jgi:membrane-bound metal-dependent hydrolase YbcI (DUF457 family)